MAITISDVRSENTRLRVLFSFIIIMLFIMGIPAIVSAEADADAARTEFQSILQDSLEALWTGQEFNPELKQRQQTLKTSLTTGVVAKAELEGMMEATILSILDRHKTSRYILKTFPERVNALFAPHMDWKAVRKIMWRAASSVAKKDGPLLLKLGTLAPPGTPWLVVPETILLPEIEKLSGGMILIKIYGGGVMGEDTDILRKMDIGQLDGCGCTALGILAASPDTSALLLPGLFNNYEEVDYIFEKFRKRLDKGFEERGYILAALIDTGFFYMFSKNKITSLADIKKQKPLTWFGTMETALYQELGINATPVAVPEVVSALSTGLADTDLAPAAWMLGMQAYQYVNYYVKQPWLYSPAAVVISANTKDRLQKQMGVSATFAHNIQEVLVAEVSALESEWKPQLRNFEEKTLKAFETKCGMKAVTFSPEDQEVMKKASQAVQQKLAGKAFPEDLIKDIQMALEEYRAKH
jgi:TRAP-type C4-dicarboxylate transport system substrate-binding protein